MSAPTGFVLGVLGAGVLYLLTKKDDSKSEVKRPPRQVRPAPTDTTAPAPGPEAPVEVAPYEPPAYTFTPDGSLPPLQAPESHPAWGRHPVPTYPPAPPPHAAHPYPPPYPPPHVAAPAYPPAPSYPPPPYPPRPRAPASDLPWVRAVTADVNRDGVSGWYAELLHSSHPVGYSETRTIGDRVWKLTIVSSTTDPQATQFARDVIGWVVPAAAVHAVARRRPAPPPPRPAPQHAAYPPPAHPAYPAAHAAAPAVHAPQHAAYVPEVQYPPTPQTHYAPAPSWPSAPAAAPGGASAFAPSGHDHPHVDHPMHADHPQGAPHPSLAFAAPGAGECKNWHPATDADVHKDGVASVYQSMLSLSETTPPKIEVHNGRTWKFQVVTPSSDPSFSFGHGVKKSVRGWICADAGPIADSSDPGY
jgi:hypothetical protein